MGLKKALVDTIYFLYATSGFGVTTGAMLPLAMRYLCHKYHKTDLGQQILTNSVNNLFSREATATTSALGLSVHNDLHCCLYLERPKGEISIGMQSKYLRTFLTRKLLNCLHQVVL